MSPMGTLDAKFKDDAGELNDGITLPSAMGPSGGKSKLGAMNQVSFLIAAILSKCRAGYISAMRDEIC